MEDLNVSQCVEGSQKDPQEDKKNNVVKQWKTVEYVTQKPILSRAKPEKGRHIRKTSEKQKKELISYFEANPSYVHVVAGAIGDNAMKNKIWSSVAKRLNEMKGGVEKQPTKWAKSWADMKVYAKARAKLAIQGQAAPNSKKPSDLDRRILMVIGQEELLTSWEAAVNDDNSTGSTSRHTILEHDYQIMDFNDSENVVEEEFTVEEHEAGQQHVIVKDLREVMKQLKQEQESGINAMEFYIDEEPEDDDIEQEDNEAEVVEEVVCPQPPNRQKKVDNVPRVIEIEDRGDHAMADAIVTLADALNNVAGALYAAVDTIKLLKR